MAGVISGYFSHVVHNMSTLKLMNPHKSYGVHLKEYITKYESRVPLSVPTGLRRAAAMLGRCNQFSN